MRRLSFRAILFVALIALAGCGHSKRVTAPAIPAMSLSEAVQYARARYHLPAFAAAMVEADSIRIAVSGVRRLGAPDSVSATDLFHIGSLTKALTATVIGSLVEEARLSWTRTLAQAFPEVADSMNAAYRSVTLEQLLQHRGGLPAFGELQDFAGLPAFPGGAVEQRRGFARWLLVRPPAATPGTYLYSNAGYAVAAAMLESAAAEPWDVLLRTRLLDPLGVSATVGWPTDHDSNQPWGHYVEGGRLVPFDPGEGHVPTIIAPAGDLSMSVGDYARFARLHLRALQGRPALLADSTFRRLHAPAGDYALGWLVTTVKGHAVWAHDGSAGTFTSLVLLDPGRDRAYAMFTNAVTPGVDSAFADVLVAVSPRTAAATVPPSAARHERRRMVR